MLDKLSGHKSQRAAGILSDRGAWFLFLPPHAPDPSPIGMPCSKLETHLRRIGARTVDDISDAIAEVRELFPPQDRRTHVKAAG